MKKRIELSGMRGMKMNKEELEKKIEEVGEELDDLKRELFDLEEQEK